LKVLKSCFTIDSRDRWEESRVKLCSVRKLFSKKGTSNSILVKVFSELISDWMH